MCSGLFTIQSSGLSSATQIASELWAVLHCGDDQWPVRVVCITFWLSPITLSLTFRLHHIAGRIHPGFSHFVRNIHAVAFLPAMNWYFLHIAQQKAEVNACHLLKSSSASNVTAVQNAFKMSFQVYDFVHPTISLIKRSKAKQDYTI